MSERALPRKKLRIGTVSERGGVNAAKTLLERNRLVVQEYDTRNDYGKDLVIDLTEGDEITGAMVAAQVKGGMSFFRGNMPFIPARLSDIRLWADSTVPVIGIVWRPQPEALYWVNLTEQCRALQAEFKRRPPAPNHVEEIRLSHPLRDDTLPHLIANMRVFAKSTSSDAYLLLLDHDDEIRREGVFACWTYGRGDARALILLRRMLPYLKGRSFLDGVWVLNALAGNPDFFGHAGNWIPREIQSEAERHLVWTAEEAATMYYEHELLDEEREGWQRGGTGQMLWHVLNPLGIRTHPPYKEALSLTVERRQMDAAYRILVALQWLAEDPMKAVTDALTDHPKLNGREDVNMLIEYIEHWGACQPYG